MDLLNIPRFIQNAFISGIPGPKITKFRDWQVSLFKNEQWKIGRNALIQVPTAGGKTIAAEVAIAQELEKDKNAKVLYCVPFVSLASEKFSYFSARFKGFRVRGFYQNVGGTDFIRGSIAVCTFEKADSLLNSSLKKDYFEDIKLVIIDEIHMLGEEQRGATIESIVIKCSLMKHKPRVIGLSATLSDNDCNAFSKFMNCFIFKHKTNENKHTSVQQYVKTYDGYLCKLENGEIIQEGKEKIESSPDDSKQVIPLIKRALENNGNIIYFVNTRREAEVKAQFIAKYLSKGNEEIIKRREELCNKLSDRRTEGSIMNNSGNTEEMKLMNSLIMKGISYHHAGLLLEERRIIELGFREGLINILVATTTLSAGLNFSGVSLVIIDNVFRTNYLTNDRKMIGIQTSHYIQMSGRAGRTEASDGKVVIIQNKAMKSEIEYIKMLSKQKIENIKTHLLHPEEFDKFMLQVICLIPDANVSNLSLLSFAMAEKNITENTEENERITSNSLERLRKNSLIDASNKATKLGLGIACANLSVKYGLCTYRNILKIEKSLNLSDSIHLMYLCVPEDIDDLFPFPAYDQNVWTSIFNKHSDVLEKNLGLSRATFDKKIVQSVLFHTKKTEVVVDEDDLYTNIVDDYDHIMRKIYCASILVDMTDENTIQYIQEKYHFSRGHLETLQNKTLTFCSQVIKLCEVCDFSLLGSAVSKFKSTILHCVSQEILPLMTIPKCTRSFARKLYNVGVQTPNDVLLLSVDSIAKILEYGSKNLNGSLSAKYIEAAKEIRKGADAISEKERVIEEMANDQV